MSKRIIRNLVCIFSFPLCFMFPSLIAGADDIIYIESNDADMEKAIAKARETVGDFFIAKQEPGALLDTFAMKVLIKDSAIEEQEHIWLSNITQKEDKMTGTIANEPMYIKNVKFGEQYTFTIDDISDWGYSKDNKMVGHYTMCVLFKTMQPEEVDYYKKNYGYKCENDLSSK